MTNRFPPLAALLAALLLFAAPRPVQAQQVLIKAVATEASIPTLLDRQLCYARDTGRLWIGTAGSGNVLAAVPVQVQQSGVPLTTRNLLNFTGSGVSVTDDPVNGATVVTITGSGGGSGSGTVTSVGLGLPSSLFAVTGSPVTTSGTLAASLLTQAANTVWAGPTVGSAAAPAFRALVAADLPIATGTARGAVTLTGDLGGTSGTFPLVVGLRGNAVSATAPTTGQVLTWSGTSWGPVTPSSGGGSVPTGSANQTLYYNSTPALANTDALWTDATSVGLGTGGILVWGPNGSTYFGGGSMYPAITGGAAGGGLNFWANGQQEIIYDSSGVKLYAGSSLILQTSTGQAAVTGNLTVSGTVTASNVKAFADGETPSGTVNGTNTAFTLAHTPVSGSVKVYVGASATTLYRFAPSAYTVTGTTLTFSAAPASGSVLLVDYRY